MVLQICLGIAGGEPQAEICEVMVSVNTLASCRVYEGDQKVFTAGGAMLAADSYHASCSRLIESNDKFSRLTGDRSVAEL